MFDLRKEINKIIDDIPSDLSQIEIIRYIYLSIGKILVSNTHFTYENEYEKRLKIFNDGKVVNFSSNEIICNSGAVILDYIFKQNFKTFGIKSDVFYTYGVDHGETIVFTSDGKMYSLNLISDLSRIQTNRKTKCFAVGPRDDSSDFFNSFSKEIETYYNHKLDSLTQSDLKTIDDKLGYTYHGLYTEDFFKMLQQEFENIFPEYYKSPSSLPQLDYEKTRKKILDFLLDNAYPSLDSVSKIGFRENYRYTFRLLKYILPRDIGKIKIQNGYINNNLSNDSMISIISLPYNNSYIYYKKEGPKYVQVSSVEIQDLLAQNLTIFPAEKIPGFEDSCEDIEI